jgi:large conductance mechanosensitive channel
MVKDKDKSVGLVKEFQAFAFRANVVDLAIAVALGGAFTAVVTAVVAGLFTPLIAALFGQTNFSALYFTWHHSEFHYGLVVNALITLIVIALALFFFVVKPIMAVRRRNGQAATPPPPMAPCPSCFTDVDLRATRCPACTEKLAAGWGA